MPPGKKATVSGVPGVPLFIQGLGMMVSPIIFTWFCFATMYRFEGSIQITYNLIMDAHNRGKLFTFICDTIGPISTTGCLMYFVWVAAQATMFLVVDGTKARGQRTPSGNILDYNCNGFKCWVYTHVFLLICWLSGIVPATLLYDNMPTVFLLANLFGLLMTVFVYVKAHVSPSHPEDARYTGCLPYDLFMGIEHNPRIGALDFKLFFNGRPGILAWTLINLSCAAKQQQLHGYITNSMILINILHAIYVLDFFWHEDWYLRTIDIAHDHFGYYLAWGDLVWLPFLYTLQAFYLVRQPVSLSLPMSFLIMIMGLIGYFIFRSANNQKDEFRRDIFGKGVSFIWGQPAEFVAASYVTSDGLRRPSPLLTNGWWGLSRHFNYVGDLLGCLAYCLTCGDNHLLPYFYFIYMTILLLHRIFRDDIRCREKYGRFWDIYCEAVPYKLIPHLF